MRLTVVCLAIVAGAAGCATRSQSVEPPQSSPQLTRSLEIRCPGWEDTCGPLMPDVFRQLEVVNHISKPSQNIWVPYTESQPLLRTDAERLWNSGMFESLWVEVTDDPYPNGIDAKRIVFNIVQRDGESAAPTGPPNLPPGFEEPAPGYERVYP